MTGFDNGVPSYIKGTATVEVYFPVDKTGKAYVSCRHCYFYKCNTFRCLLNNEVCNYPETHKGDWCPLKFDEE